MNVYLFGLHSGHLPGWADRIARKHGASHINFVEPNGHKRGWFSCPNRGEPFDRLTAKAVLDEIAVRKEGKQSTQRTTDE